MTMVHGQRHPIGYQAKVERKNTKQKSSSPPALVPLYGKQVHARHKKINLLIAEELALAGSVVSIPRAATHTE